MKALKDIIRCPHCASSDIVYSCEPKCCFNHVCSDCRSTFEINTVKTGQSLSAATELEEPQSGDPTTGCASCDSLRVAVWKSENDETLLLCGKCGAISRILIEEFVAGNF